jgi:AcrR family transcriptional regulator
MSADDRRELVLAAATRAFSRGGYAGTSTDAVAREAEVSQPYVVRIFGTKLALFLEVLDRSCERIRAAFQAVLDEGPFDPENDEDWSRLGLAYTELLRDRDLLMVMMHGFSGGDVDEIARCSRAGMSRIFATVRSTGCSDERAQEFIAQGMLLNVMLSMRAPEHLDDDPELAALTRCAFGDALPFVLA